MATDLIPMKGSRPWVAELSDHTQGVRKADATQSYPGMVSETLALVLTESPV
jgi:hypothetical protein